MKKTILILTLTLMSISCSNFKDDKNALVENEKLQLENDSLKKIVSENTSSTKQPIATFLTFQKNNAETAMNFYVKLFDNSKIIKIQRWGKNGPVEEGKIMHATFELNGNLFMCSDSP
ncbi:MAG: VOC family protein, partial [Flavobacteriaceae bacterium]